MRAPRPPARPPRKPEDDRDTTITAAEDLARLSATPPHLARARALLATRPGPRLSRVTEGTEGTDLDSPVGLVKRHYQHRRVAALLAPVGNPHTLRAAVTSSSAVTA
ncbi:hypothetical protein AB0L74_28655 [Streptomyces sp. NPDC052020]|uniref:hypothetical protein n=1 Tax=Streptomyces sp. NPDC052020 TaxID=3155677 RepID=UPI00341631D8